MKFSNNLLFSCVDSTNAKPCIESNMTEFIRTRDKLRKTFLHTKLHVDYEYLKEQQDIVQREIKQKEKLPKNSTNPEEIWKALKNLRMPCKVSHQPKIFLRENNLLQFNKKKNANTFKDFYSNLALNLVSRLPAP